MSKETDNSKEVIKEIVEANEAAEAEKTSEKREVEVYAERAETDTASIELADVRAAALAYAKFLKSQGLKPGDATFMEPEDLGIEVKSVEAPAAAEEPSLDFNAAGSEETPVEKEAPAVDSADEKAPAVNEAAKEVPIESADEKKAAAIAAAAVEESSLFNRDIKIKHRKVRSLKARPFEKRARGVGFLAKMLDVKDAVQTKVDDTAVNMGRDFISASHSIAASYRNTRRSIGLALLAIGIMASAVLIIFDHFTVYEYAYNGKVLGYVKEQEEVTDVLQIAGEKLTQNSGRSLDITFVPNQNITFNLVDSSNKTLDDADTAVNKLVYMTDIETEAYGIYDGEDSLVAIVKSSEDAEDLLLESLNEMSRPDRGMTLVKAEFDNQLDVRPLNVLLTSVQDNDSARKQMVEGGSMEIYHIVEEGETLDSLVEDYTTDRMSIYDETNTDVAETIEQGDRVCIHKTVNPVTVTMVEKGQLKETVEYKTIKKETDEYYKGDTFIEQDGKDGTQIFEGTITKKAGEVVDRDGEIIEVSKKVQDKIILVGTAERPKTAPTGTYAMPIYNYVLTSPYGPRWGTIHNGLDMAGPTGTPIYASDGGTVVFASGGGGYGNRVDIDHGNGRMTRYAHCSALLVSAGEKVYQGQQIALVGSTGNSTGPHLHFEIILNGSQVNPAPYLGI